MSVEEEVALQLVLVAGDATVGPQVGNADAGQGLFVAAPDYPLALDLLVGVERQKSRFVENLRRFAKARPANPVLLWGARGAGKSSMVKAAFMAVAAEQPSLRLIEVDRDEVTALPRLFERLRGRPERFLVLCDDLSFEEGAASAKALKSALEGGVGGPPENVLFTATSNRRHLMPRDMIENERSTAINPGEAVEEKVSLSDRFGLWLGFHPCSQDDYLEMIRGYCGAHGVSVPEVRLQAEAIEWQATRGGRSGRVAWQFFCDLAAREGVRIRA